MVNNKSFIAKFLIVVLLMGSIWVPIDNAHLEKVGATGIVEISTIPVGSIVIDNTWSYNGFVEWMLISASSHFQHSHYDNTNLEDHVTIITNNTIAQHVFHNTNYTIPWTTRTLRINFLQSTFYNSTSTQFKDNIVLTTTKTGEHLTSNTVTTNNETIFILSATEMGLVNPNIYGSDGLAIPFFNSNSRRIADSRYYHTRTPYNTTYPYQIGELGYIGTWGLANQSGYWVRPAVNLRSNTKVQPTGVWKLNSAGQNVQVYDIVYNQPPILTLSSPSNNRDILLMGQELQRKFNQNTYGKQQKLSSCCLAFVVLSIFS